MDNELKTKIDAAIAEMQTSDDSFECDCEECGTWDGQSRRCECGNRRVFWDHSINADGSILVFPSCD